MNDCKKSPLRDKLPSLFIVTSPFQAMCAMEAIETLKISNYSFVVSCAKDSRDKQLYHYLDEQGIDYVVEDMIGKRYINTILKVLFHRNSKKINRAFLGDSDNMYQYLSAYKYLSRDSMIVFMDDGTKNIPVLMGKRKREQKNKYKICENIIRKFYNIKITNSFFTLFSDIAAPKFECIPNTFSHIAATLKSKERKGVFYIGTNSIEYCKKLDISKDAFIKSLDEQFEILRKKYKDEPIIYIPHGRDLNESVKTLCYKHDVKYHIADKTVELFILNQPTKPIAIYANTSTALFNLKLLYPDVEILNIFCLGNPNSKYFEDYAIYSNYFEKHGIPLIDKLDVLKA